METALVVLEVIGYVIAAAVLWVALGYFSCCVCVGTWERQEKYFEYKGSPALELARAFALGPWVGLELALKSVRTGEPIGFALLTNWRRAFPF
ncbi:MAG TPA: hypothetical protein VJZ94_00360 [Candidatus Paceibacterota bacterium]|uniref:Uncharacterized protein n=1 Tax=Candidatus Kaiserbacteria bacterium RIFCSPLOWO2_01_FULL_51_21 TaxID=1798508 RepID=A0A1F6EEA3_9BACT|nr:MAG: hypothetical protein A2761_03385 [Candidatus Kaiserbacteria bacterium RIFCSPHIGHO2_01_FULL_51_33]OGG63421.1 MAG: hypothetical protein A3D66_02240 [Candidatus Kaiserbacteria bacterium RIFCSPHIGHO2_02_FULL_50_9]OGG71993.1 MAG: hypothetical protein A3A35_01215 [Candidatus Kaiserbacteria bacterium RIFCSPLOWO2_01_FULL_51_21]HXK31193.1 hypothetical protein [Candidatus Paceibacterota bacterium]